MLSSITILGFHALLLLKMLDGGGNVVDYEVDEIHLAKGIKPAGRRAKSSGS
jgi:hypothetical protein